MPLGDSITKGEDASTDDAGYRRSLYLQLIDAGYDVEFVGRPSEMRELGAAIEVV